MILMFFLLCFVAVSRGQETEDDTKQKDSWWVGFKSRVKTVLSKWREDFKSLWDDVLAKADDMRGWTSEMFDSFKKKMKEWLESRPEVPDDEKNEIETFISKLKIPTENPIEKPKFIEP